MRGALIALCQLSMAAATLLLRLLPLLGKMPHWRMLAFGAALYHAVFTAGLCTLKDSSYFCPPNNPTQQMNVSQMRSSGALT
jgi:hypothetical protein